MRVGIYTLGCKVNQYETQAMEQELLRRGHELVSFESVADAYIVNTCSVTAVSDKKSRQMLRRCRRLNGEAVVAACGCYVQTHADEAATLDGANKVAQFTKITLPLMKGIIRTSITFWSINTTTFFLWTKMFSSINTEGSTIVPVVYLYDTVFGGTGVVERDAGAGAAVGVVLTLIIIAIYVVMNKLLKDTDLEY